MLAAAGRLYQIDAADVWVDEANLILTSGRPLPELFAKLRLDSSPPLYYLLIHFWSALAGDGAVALRLPAVAAGVALAWATWWAGREAFSPAAGLWAALAVALSPVQMFYSQQVRMYALLALLALLSTLGLVRFLREGRRGDFALWLGGAVAALYTHNFAVHLGLAHLALVAMSGQLARRWRDWALATVLVALAYAPWVPILLEQLGNRDHYAWFELYWNAWGPFGALWKSFQSFSPAGEFLTYQGIGSFAVWRGFPAAGACALALFGAWQCARRARDAGALALWPLVLLAVPIASGLVFSTLATPHYVSGRVDQMLLPAFALLLGAGLAALRPSALRWALAAVVAGLGLWSQATLYDIYADDPLAGGDRALAAAVAEAWQPGDVVLCTSLSRAPLAYYLGRAGVEAPLVSYPRAAAQHLGAQNDARLLADRAGLLREAEASLALARARTGDSGRVIVVWVRSEVNYPLRHEALTAEHGLTEVANLGRFRQYGTALAVDVRVYR